jgi:Flp pilus assembly protein TadG
LNFLVRRLRRSALPASAASRRREHGQGLVEFAIVVPIMFVLVVAVGDFGRVFTSGITVESAAREAADYGGSLGAARWDETDAAMMALNDAEIRRRACTAASQLPDYVGSPGPDDTSDCASPTVTWNLVHPPGVTNCSVPTGFDQPCQVHVVVTYDFHTFIPVLPIPDTITFTRESWFAISDLTGT